MLLSPLLLCILAFCSMVISSPSNQNLSLADMPACALHCTASILGQVGCGTKDFTACFCNPVDITLRLDISVCTIQNCSITDQTTASIISQKIICAGYPQPSKGPEEISTTAIITAVSMFFVALRLVSRILITGKLGWDDWLIIFTAVVMIANTTIQTIMCHHGFGKHIFDVSPEEAPFLGKMFFASQIIYVFNQNLPKISILILYLQIFTSPDFVRIVKLTIAWSVAHTIAFLVATVFQCNPVAKSWDTGDSGTCLNKQAFIYAGAGFSIAEDIVIMLLPVIELRKLNVRWRKRVDLMLMFAIGSFACMASIIRLKFISKFGKSIDVTFDNVDIVIWSEIETYTAVICSCLIPIRPLLLKWIPDRIFGISSKTKNSSCNTPSSRTKRSQNRFKYSDNDGDQSPLHQSRKDGIIVEATVESYELQRRDTESPTAINKTTDESVERHISFLNA